MHWGDKRLGGFHDDAPRCASLLMKVGAYARLRGMG
jgi:hypothetical protein